MKRKYTLFAVAALIASGCTSEETVGVRTDALEDSLWEKSEWIAAADAPVVEGKVGELIEGTAKEVRERAADGASWFVSEPVNPAKVEKPFG